MKASYQSQVQLAFHLAYVLSSLDVDPHGRNQCQATVYQKDKI